MIDWCMAHPWMTFFIVILALIVIDGIQANIVRLILVMNGKSIYVEKLDDKEDK